LSTGQPASTRSQHQPSCLSAEEAAASLRISLVVAGAARCLPYADCVEKLSVGLGLSVSL
jgi:hypothetical protein